MKVYKIRVQVLIVFVFQSTVCSTLQEETLGEGSANKKFDVRENQNPVDVVPPNVIAPSSYTPLPIYPCSAIAHATTSSTSTSSCWVLNILNWALCKTYYLYEVYLISYFPMSFTKSSNLLYETGLY